MAVKLYRKLGLFKQFFCKKDGVHFSLVLDHATQIFLCTGNQERL